MWDRKKEEQLVLAILSKLGPDYSMFVLTFPATKLTAQASKMHKLAEFMEFITQEQDKLVMMGTIKPFGCWRLEGGFKRQEEI